MSDTRRHVSPGALDEVGACAAGRCTHRKWLGHAAGVVRDVRRCLHFASEKSLARDRVPFSKGQCFRHGMQADRHLLQQKVEGLRFREALDPDRAPRRRKNHGRSDDNGWDRMVRHGDALAWETYEGQHRRER